MPSNITDEEYNKLIKRLEFCDTTRNSLLTFSFTAVLAALGVALNVEMDEVSSWLCLLPYFLIIPFSARISYYRLSSAHINSFLRVFAKDQMKFELGTSVAPENIFKRYIIISWLVNHEMVLLGAASSCLFGYKYRTSISSWSFENTCCLIFAGILVLFVYFITDSTNNYKKLIFSFSNKWKTYDIEHPENYEPTKQSGTVTKRIWQWTKVNCALVVTTILAITMFVLWQISTDTHNYSDLWLNLLAGFITSIITITVIDNIIKKQQEKKEKPFRIALYRDIQFFSSKLISFWQEMYVQSNVNRDNISVNELFTAEQIGSIYVNLDLEGNPNIIPKQDWFTYIDEASSDLIERGNRILDRYVSVAEPELFQAIHHLVNDSPFIGVLWTAKRIRLVDISNKIPRHPLLQSYVIAPTDKDYSAIKTLLTWCQEEYNKVNDTDTAYQIADKITIINPDIPPSSVMTEEKMRKFSQDFEIWTQSNSKIK